MALEGNLKDFGLADILQMIYFQRKTGLLILDGKTDNVRISFFEGKIVGASSRRKTETNRLGRLLVARGVIDEAALQDLLGEKNIPAERLAKYLYREGLADAEVVQPVVEELMSETVVHLFSWKEGHYEFATQDVVADVDFPIELDTEHLLMEGLRIVDEWSVLEGKIDPQAVYQRTGVEPEDLREDERRVLQWVDGFHDVSMVIELSGLDDFEAGKAIVDLFEKGVIDTVEVADVARETPGEKPRVSPLAIGMAGVGLVWAICVTLMIFMSVSGFVGFFRYVRAGAGVEDGRLALSLHRHRGDGQPERLDETGFTRKDPWGKPYVLVDRSGLMTVVSGGPDGVVGTADDVQ